MLLETTVFVAQTTHYECPSRLNKMGSPATPEPDVVAAGSVSPIVRFPGSPKSWLSAQQDIAGGRADNLRPKTLARFASQYSALFRAADPMPKTLRVVTRALRPSVFYAVYTL